MKEYFKLTAGERLSGIVGSTIILHIWQNTYAFPRRKDTPPPEYAAINLSGFAKVAHCSKVHAWAALQDMKRRELLTWLTPAQAKKAGLVPKKGEHQALWFKLLPENWATAAPYKPSEIDPGPVEVEDDAAEDPEAEDSKVEVKPSLPIVMCSGQSTRAAELPPDARRYSLSNETPWALRVDSILRNGVMRYVIRDEMKALTDSTVKVQLYSNKSGDKAYLEARDRLILTMAEWGSDIEEVFADRLLSTMGGPQNLDRFFTKGADSYKRLKRRGELPMSPGILLTVAQDVVAKRAAVESAQKRRQSAPPAERPPAAGRRGPSLEEIADGDMAELLKKKLKPGLS